MRTIELFSGTKSFSKVMRRHGHAISTFDNDQRLKPQICCDIFGIESFNIPIDIIWASPPCTTFSVASLSHYWTDGKPKNAASRKGIRLLDQTIKIIANTKPKYWFIENPRGMMRKVIDRLFKRHGITGYVRHTVSYCQYGAKIMKPTDIWTNCIEWKPREICKPGSSCHERAGRGAKTGVQGIYNLKWEKSRGHSGTARGVVPPRCSKRYLMHLHPDAPRSMVGSRVSVYASSPER